MNNATSFVPPAPRRTAAWMATSTALALVATGTVLALAAEGTEADIADLLSARLGNGQPLRFDGAVRANYEDLVATGERYQRWSRLAWGGAAASMVTAAVLFVTSRTPAREGRTQVTPVLNTDHVGLAASLTF